MARNPFDTPIAARRFGEGRPYFHPRVMEQVRRKLGLSGKLARALDVGCGTGLSSRALLSLAEKVDAVDPSAAMLAAARRDPGIAYLRATGEALPFPDALFSLATVSQALHWMDTGKFFREARRVLAPGAPLVLYDDYFRSEAGASTPFAVWLKDAFAKRFPPPPRETLPLGPEGKVRPAGFRFAGFEEFAYVQPLTVPALADLLMTQSGVAAAAADRRRTREAADWLRAELRALFGAAEDPIPFDFGGPIYYLRKEEQRKLEAK